ncbi:MAG: extracellular solute-binding protein family 5, partial [Thermomicrobiales bacterium]|nr:extracellular solute-binding protein family 5 [Thermomicrobiales bacterium]
DTGDPQVLAFLNEIEISSKVFVPLLALNEENQVAAAAAESMAVSEDGMTYTFTIRDGMTYTDGVPVTVEHYAYAIKRACSPVVAGNYSNILFDIVGCEEWRSADVAAQEAELPDLEAAVDESIKALDDRTLQIQLERPAGYFPYVMATWVSYPSRQDLVEAGGDQWWGNPETYIGNGPFKLVSWTPDQEWVTTSAASRGWLASSTARSAARRRSCSPISRASSTSALPRRRCCPRSRRTRP